MISKYSYNFLVDTNDNAKIILKIVIKLPPPFLTFIKCLIPFCGGQFCGVKSRY